MYVRTKDGVYEVEQSQLEDDDEVVNCEYGQISKLEIKRKSENLEELCDEFVFVNKVGNFDKSYVIYYNIPNHRFTEPTIEEKIAYIKKYYKDELDKIRGAIYTDKGLIYVAKMNDKGELCLL